MAEDKLPLLSHCFRHSLWPLWDRRTAWAILALLTLIGGLYLWQAEGIAALQHRIGGLEEEHEHWQQENAELRKEITELTQITALTERAQALGFTIPQGEIYLQFSEGDVPTSVQGMTP